MKVRIRCPSVLVHIAFITVFGLCIAPQSVKAACGNFVSVVSISETAANGTVLLNLTKDAGDTVEFDIETNVNDKAALKIYFHLNANSSDTTFSLITAKVLDLELLYSQFHLSLTTIVLTFTCANVPNNEVSINVNPVNEFMPTFIGAPYHTTMNESEAVDATIYSFAGKVSDQDIPQQNTFGFRLEPYIITEMDGKDVFQIPTSTIGVITLKKTIDYDNPANRKPFTQILNISVTDNVGQSGSSKITYTTLNITIQDVDDQKPYFDYPNCGTPCTAPPYETLTELDKTGLLQIKPIPITARDDDTLGTRLVYSIESGNEHNLFSVNPNNGNVTQVISVRDSGLMDKEFRIVIQVRKTSSAELSAIAILTIGVKERLPFRNDTTYPEAPAFRSETQNTDLLIPVVILGCVLLLVIIAIIVTVIIIRRKQKQMMVRPEDDKSEPQTEEEDIHTDRSDEFNTRTQSNERLVFNGKATLGVGTDAFPPTPSGKAGLLAPLPLRDSATETTEGGRKKRSRRRNKKKEPEIFDGTKEYNMGMDPEFFDSTDKSRVKRSQRSYDKKADPALRIQVPNDNVEDN